MPLWVAMLVSEDVRGWKGGDSEDGKPRLYAATRRQVHQRRRVPRTDEAGPRRRGRARRLPVRRRGQTEQKAERVGFEPTRRLNTAYAISNRAPSANSDTSPEATQGSLSKSESTATSASMRRIDWK